jgi:hypothetical protein
MRWVLFDYNEDNLAIDIQIALEPYGETEIVTTLEDVKVAIPHVVCAKIAVTNFVASMARWARLPMEELRDSDFRYDSNLRAADYEYRDSLRVEVRPTRIRRSAGDQRHFQLTWEDSFDRLSCGFVIDVTGADLFCRGVKVNRSEPGAAPNGGPATPLGNPGVTDGPPSVS